ncbi:hypothetical protein [Alcanivorax sp. 1008]|uniref:hypothetical protein n=1 Tax=Alcanivorax sp. 1008 TaxID=2816853 RepID=UPI001DEDAE4F|nr:hypothetical protein [Alcanivorax sp. 1008]MCC1498134.1 hypothetical protein [Alcanivorax sp. 1008]
MTMRLLLALLMILSAPLAAAQHLGCGQMAAVPVAATATAATSDSHVHQPMASAEHHDHRAAMTAAISATADAEQDCENCDLACLAACAAVAMPASITDIRSAVSHITPELPYAADLLLSHPTPLLRPPTPASA